MLFKSFGIVTIFLIAWIPAFGQINRDGKGYVFRVTFAPKQTVRYQVTNRTVGSQVHTTPTTVNVTCTEIKDGFYNVEVDEQVSDATQDQADSSSFVEPIYKKTWVTNRGHSAHKYAFWYTTCPYGPVKLKSFWKGNPPPLAESLGAPASAGFDYTLTGFEQRNGAKAARIGFKFIQRATTRNPQESSYAGGMLIDNANGQILDLTVTKTERTFTKKPLVVTYVKRLVRV